MQSVWVVILIASLSSCGADPIQDRRKGLSFVPEGCLRVEGGVENDLRASAHEFFVKNLGVEAYDIDVGILTRCSDMYVVPIWARTKGVPTGSRWYVEIDRDGVHRLRRPF